MTATQKQQVKVSNLSATIFKNLDRFSTLDLTALRYWSLIQKNCWTIEFLPLKTLSKDLQTVRENKLLEAMN